MAIFVKWPFFAPVQKKHAGAGCCQKLRQNTAVSAKMAKIWPFWPFWGVFFKTKVPREAKIRRFLGHSSRKTWVFGVKNTIWAGFWGAA